MLKTPVSSDITDEYRRFPEVETGGFFSSSMKKIIARQRRRSPRASLIIVLVLPRNTGAIYPFIERLSLS
jgi:hypothetical protein